MRWDAPKLDNLWLGGPRSVIYDELGRDMMDVTADWFWEGNVVEAIVRFLVQAGWTIEAKADTHSRERGVDIQASRDGRTLLVEAKGYPAKTYRDPRRAGEVKPTNPTNQAQQWYSHALLKVMRLQTKYPHALVALGFPDFPRYRALFKDTHGGLAKLGVAMLTVRADGHVDTWGLHGKD
ncbi:MAG TPA: hypothetical protein VFA81_06215 [Burkholderiales bacterium]|nr:hypothetical protein [Burkholderiales bacterium]